MDSIELGSEDKAFTRGGNRLCFIDPRDNTRCVKVLRPDRSPETRRQQKGFPKNLRSLDSFNENLEEFSVWQDIEKRVGVDAFKYITRCYGFVDTEYGPGLVMDLVCDHDQKISKTLKQYLWEQGLSPTIKHAVQQFAEGWVLQSMPSKKLLLHNILLKRNKAGEFRVYVIDGLGWASIIPVSKYVKSVAKRRAEKKVRELWRSIDELLLKKKQNDNYGYHGWLDENQRVIKQNGKN